MKRVYLIIIMLFLAGAPIAAQVPDVQVRWFPLEEDSLRVEYALPSGGMARSAVVVLSDRFGMQENVRAMLKVLAQMGFRAYALPLRSTPLRSVSGIPDFTVDSSDIAVVTQVAVDILNDAKCNGHVALLAFDVGALVAIDVIERFPFFKSAALLYPPTDASVLRRLLDAKTKVQLHLAQFDPVCTLAAVNTLREQFMEAGKQLHVFYYKEAHRFFFNPEHEHYHRENTQRAWNQVLKQFRSTM